MSALALMPMAATMATVRRFALTDITDILRTPVRLTDTMARRGLAVESLLERGRGTGMPIMAGATTAIVDTAMAAVMAMDTDEDMAMVVVMRMVAVVMAADIAVAMLAVVAATEVAVSMAAEASTAAAVMVAADTGNIAD